MKKPKSRYLFAELSYDEFQQIIRGYHIELFQFGIVTKSIFLDEEGGLGSILPEDSALFGQYRNDTHFLFLRTDKGQVVEEWKDFLYEEEYHALLDDGVLPSAERSVVANRLAQMGIKSGLKYMGNLSEEEANITRNVFPESDKIEFYLEKTQFPDTSFSFRLVVWYDQESDKGAAMALLDDFVKENDIEKRVAPFKMYRFFFSKGS